MICALHRIQLTVLLTLIAFFSFSQGRDYGILSEGEMPEDFSTSFTGKFEASLNDEEIKDLEKSSKEFAALINFSIDNLLKSGKIVYGDPITKKSNSIIKNLLKNSDLTKYNIRLYTLKSNDVNAYSTHQGIIILTTGLVARLHNESELAYVLSHEIAHVIHKHSVNSFSYNKELFKKEVSKNGGSIDESVLQSTKHSRENEFDADTKGFELYTNAGYAPELITCTFQRLLYAYLPVKQVKFDFEKYEDSFYKLNEDTKEFEPIDIDIEEDVDDSKSSHPNIFKRKENIKSKIISSLEPKISIPEDDFNQLRSLAYKECIYQYIVDADYINALILLDAIDSEISITTSVTNRFRAMCFLGIQKFADNNQEDLFLNGNKLQGHQGLYHHVFSNLNKRELQVLAFREIAKLWDNNPNDLVIERMMAQGAEILSDNVDTDEFANSIADSTETRKKCFTCEFALVNIQNREKLNSIFKSTDTAKDSKGVATVNQKNVVMLSPKYIAMDTRKSVDERFLETEKEKEYIEDKILEYGEDLDMQINIIDYWQGGNITTQDFNKYVLMMDWLHERANYAGNNFQGLLYEEISDLAKSYNTDALAFSSYWNLLERKKFKPVGLLTLAIPYTFPLYLYWQLTPHHYTGYSYVMLDTKTGKVLYVDSKEFDMKYNKKLVNAHLYNSLNQIAK